MGLGSSIGTRNVARTATTDADIIKIDDIEFSSEVTRRWKHSIVTAAKNVPTNIVGPSGTHRHTYTVESNAIFTVRSGGTGTNPATSPGALSYTKGVDTANRTTTMAQEREDHEANLKMFHTQDGGHHQTLQCHHR